MDQSLIYRELVLPFVRNLTPLQYCQICFLDVDLSQQRFRWVPHFILSDTIFRSLRPFARTQYWPVCLVCRQCYEHYGFELMEDEFLFGHS